MAEPTGPAPTGPAPTGPAPTGGTGGTGATGKATGPTGPDDPRLREVKVPEKYANQPWAKEVKSVEDLWDKMNGAQKLIGKDKIVLPGDNATKEEIEAFQIKMGRPQNAEGYEFKSIDDLKEVERNVEMDHGMKKIFLEEGISKEVGERIVSKYESLIYGMQKPAIEIMAKREQDFAALATEVLGDDREASMNAFKTTLKESLGDKAHLADRINNMDNDQLLAMIVLSKNIHDKYSGESRVHRKPGDPPGPSGDLKADFQALSTQKLAIKMDDKMPEHIKKQKVMNINLQISKIGVQAKDKGIDLFS